MRFVQLHVLPVLAPEEHARAFVAPVHPAQEQVVRAAEVAFVIEPARALRQPPAHGHGVQPVLQVILVLGHDLVDPRGAVVAPGARVRLPVHEEDAPVAPADEVDRAGHEPLARGGGPLRADLGERVVEREFDESVRGLGQRRAEGRQRRVKRPMDHPGNGRFAGVARVADRRQAVPGERLVDDAARGLRVPREQIIAVARRSHLREVDPFHDLVDHRAGGLARGQAGRGIVLRRDPHLVVVALVGRVLGHGRGPGRERRRAPGLQRRERLHAHHAIAQPVRGFGKKRLRRNDPLLDRRRLSVARAPCDLPTLGFLERIEGLARRVHSEHLRVVVAAGAPRALERVVHKAADQGRFFHPSAPGQLGHVQLVLGACERHVEETSLLRLPLLALRGCGVGALGQVVHRVPRGRILCVRGAVRGFREPARHKDDRELEPFARVHGEYLHLGPLGLHWVQIHVASARGVGPVFGQSLDHAERVHALGDRLLFEDARHVLVVGDAALAVSARHLADENARVAEDRSEQRGPVAPLAQILPLPEERLDRMVGRQVVAARQRVERHIEERRQERLAQRARVVRMRDRPEQTQEVQRLVRLEQAFLLVEGVRHARLAKRPFERRDAATPADQNGDVVRAERARAVTVVRGDLDAGLVEQAADLARREPGEDFPGVRRGRRRVVNVHHGERAAQRLVTVHARARVVGRRRHRRIRDARVGEPVALFKECVVRLDQLGRAAPVLLQGFPCGPLLLHERSRGVEIRLHVRPAEAVDRLLRVAHHDQAVSVVAREDRSENLPLHGVGILELVQKRDAVSRAKRAQQRGVGRQRVAHADEHVVVVDETPLAFVRVGGVDEAPDRFRNESAFRAIEKRDEAVERRTDLRQTGACLAHRGVRLEAGRHETAEALL